MAKSGKDAVQGAVQSVLCMVLWSFVFSVLLKRSVLVLNFAVVFLLHTLLQYVCGILEHMRTAFQDRSLHATI